MLEAAAGRGPGELRTIHVPETAASQLDKLERYLGLGHSEQDAAGAFGVKASVIRNMVAVLRAGKTVLSAVRSGDVALSAAAQIAKLAKLKAGRLNRIIPDACLQFWGGMGYIEETRVNRFWRDTRLGSIGGGADEVMLGIIAKTMGIVVRAREGH